MVVHKLLVHALLALLINPLSAKFIKWSNTLKQFVCKLPTNCLSVFDHFVGLAPKGLSCNGCLCIVSLQHSSMQNQPFADVLQNMIDRDSNTGAFL